MKIQHKSLNRCQNLKVFWSCYAGTQHATLFHSKDSVNDTLHFSAWWKCLVIVLWSCTHLHLWQNYFPYIRKQTIETQIQNKSKRTKKKRKKYFPAKANIVVDNTQRQIESEHTPYTHMCSVYMFTWIDRQVMPSINRWTMVWVKIVYFQTATR